MDSRFRIVGTGSLYITSVDESDAGNYQCRASNSVDSLDIQATLNVQVPPKFIESPTDKMALEKEELELVCLIRGKPTPVIHWLKNGDIITPNDYMQVVGGHNLRILGLINSDAGMFQCIGSNPAGSVQAAARLQIEEPGNFKHNFNKHFFYIILFVFMIYNFMILFFFLNILFCILNPFVNFLPNFILSPSLSSILFLLFLLFSKNKYKT